MEHQGLTSGKKEMDYHRYFDVYPKYVPFNMLGSGAYGSVCASTNKETGEKVAIKKIPNAFQNRMIASRTLREITVLRNTDHDNIIPIKDLILPGTIDTFQDVYIATELMETDLHKLLQYEERLGEDYVQYFFYQLLRGLKYLHSGNILHRDLKPSNILVNCSNCILKICDFGLSRISTEGDFLTEYVVTRPYRSPELLLGSRDYSASVDIWSAGVIFVEMLTGSPLFPVRNREEHPVHHLKMITELVGSPDASDLEFLVPEQVRAQIHSALKGREKKPFASRYPNANACALDLAEKMLRFDPAKRITAVQALDHPYLSALHDPSDEPTYEGNFGFEDAYPSNLNVDEIRSMIWREASAFNPHLTF